MKSNNKLSSYIHGFLQEYLILQKGFSRHTVLSYRDTIKLFLNFSATSKKRPVTDLTIADLGAAMVVDFLDYLEKERDNSRQTRNIRLACLHSFFAYLIRHDPLIFDHCQRVLVIPFKRTGESTVVEYLERDEMQAILEAVDRSTQDGSRYYTLLYFLYNTGARVQEVIDLPAKAFQLQRPFQVRFRGKGAKERLCPLWSDTVKLLHSLLKQRGLDPQSNTPVFVNHRGQPLTRHGIRYLLNKYVQLASKNCPTLQGRHIHPHSIRHTTAMHLLQAGVDINTIRAWLGHTKLETTNRYAQINLEMKRKVLDNYLPVPKTNKHPWKQNPDLLQWLDSL